MTQQIPTNTAKQSGQHIFTDCKTAQTPSHERPKIPIKQERNKKKGSVANSNSAQQHPNSNSLHNVKTTGHTHSNGQLLEPHRIPN